MTGKNQQPTRICPPRKCKTTSTMVSASTTSTTTGPTAPSSNRVTKSKAIGSSSATKSTKVTKRSTKKPKQPAKSNRRAKKAKSPTPESDEDDGVDDDEDEEEEIKPTKKQPNRGGARKARGNATTRRPTTRSRKGLASTQDDAVPVEHNVAPDAAPVEDNAAPSTEATESIPPAPTQTVQDTTARDPPIVTPAAESSRSQTQTDEEFAWALHRELSQESGRNQRSTRSRTGRIRVQTELASFFPDYEEVMGFVEKETEYLDVDAEMLVIDDEVQSDEAQGSSEDRPAGEQSATQDDDKPNKNNTSQEGNEAAAPPAESSSASTGLWNVQKLDLSSAEGEASSAGKDPLAETMYSTAHHRAEHREKRLRNIEKEKAQHEQTTLERILEGLQGADWLRVLGITGISGSEKKEYLPRRYHFIEEVTALIQKIRVWREQERRERPGRAQKGPAQAEEGGRKGKRAVRPQCDGADESEVEPSDVDAEAARQLHQEAIMATASTSLGSKRKREEDPEEMAAQWGGSLVPLGSFFAKRYQRDAALGSHRRSGRGALAFGHPIPEMAEREFEVPGDIATEEAIAARARLRRRLRRRGA